LKRKTKLRVDTHRFKVRPFELDQKKIGGEEGVKKGWKSGKKNRKEPAKTRLLSELRARRVLKKSRSEKGKNGRAKLDGALK